MIIMARKFHWLLIFVYIILSNSQICISGCKYCTDSYSCQQCYERYYITRRNKCRPCPDNCQKCTRGEDFELACTQCVIGYQLDKNGICIACSSNCKTCSQSPTNCTSCSQQLSLIQSPNGNICFDNITCFIPECISCSYINSPSDSICTKCEKGFFNFRRYCDKCMFPCADCQINLENLWNNEVLPFWNSTKENLYNIIQNKTSNSKRLLRAQSQQNIQQDKTYSMNKLQTSSPFTFNTNDYNYQNYKNWTLDDWNASDWTSQVLTTFESMDQTKVKGYIEAYIFFKTINQTLPINSSLLQIIYQSLPIVNQLLDLTYETKEQWNHLARYISKLIDFQWNGSYLSNNMVYNVAKSASCSNCMLGYFLNNQSLCQACSKNCLKCENIDKCLQCDLEYFPANGSCQSCPYGCISCSQDICLQCQYPLSLSQSNSICILCQYPCNRCYSNNNFKCLTCQFPYSLFPFPNGTCYKCNEIQCSQCNSSTLLCTSCIAGYVLSNNSCFSCGSNCQQCAFNNKSFMACQACNRGYFLITSNFTCSPCKPGCVSCSFSQQNTTNLKCHQCIDGFYLDNQTSSCLICSQQCETCSSFYICTKYSSQITSYRESNVLCSKGCQKCHSQNPSICLECSERYYLQSGRCLICGANCLKCINNLKCNECMLGTKLVNDVCQYCSNNCLQCSSSKQCLRCISGYYLLNGICNSQCSEGCSSCSSSQICSKCQSGYTLVANGTCSSCLSTCTGLCNPKNITQCLMCSLGFQMVDNTCISCPNGCLTCINQQCTSCIEGYQISQTIDKSGAKIRCQFECLSPCAVCLGSDIYSCTECIKGYQLDKYTGLCVANTCNPYCSYCPPGTYNDSSLKLCKYCPQNCASCSATVCHTCFDGYYVNDDGVCEYCAQECYICYNKHQCMVCAPGFTKQVIISFFYSLHSPVYGDKCIPCDQNCLTCSILPTMCTSCRNEYTLNVTQCISNYYIQYQYQLNRDYEEFISNSQSLNFTNALCSLLFISANQIRIDYIVEGSTIIGGSIITSGKEEANYFEDTLNNNQYQVGNYIIISSNIQVINSDPYPSPSPFNDNSYSYNGEFNFEDNELSSGAKIGIIVGSLVAAFIIFVIILFCCCKDCIKQDITNIEKDSKFSNERQAQLEQNPDILPSIGSQDDAGRSSTYQYFNKS